MKSRAPSQQLTFDLSNELKTETHNLSTTMKTFLTCAAFATVLGAVALPNNASAIDLGRPRVHEVNGRLNNEQRRINNGVVTGRLSPGQAIRLERGEQQIRRQENFDLARNGGHLTPREQVHLNREENVQSRRINQTEHRNFFHRLFGRR